MSVGWGELHLRPYEYRTMVGFADHMEHCHGLDHQTAYSTDREGLVVLHQAAHNAQPAPAEAGPGTDSDE